MNKIILPLDLEVFFILTPLLAVRQSEVEEQGRLRASASCPQRY